MLTIRSEQLKAFSQAEAKKFEDWMLVHLTKFFPARCVSQGEDKIRQAIRHSIQRASEYGLVSKRDVCKYIDHVAVFGRDFDIDQRFPWASKILASQRIPSAKIRALSQAAQQHLTGL